MKGASIFDKVRKTASLKSGGCIAHKFAGFAARQLLRGTKRGINAYRWMAESAFSCIKRIFGEHIICKVVNKLLLKALTAKL